MEQTSDVLAGSRVLRFGKRQAVDVCAAMLAAGGAEIIVAEEHEALPLDGVDIVIAASDIASPTARAALSALKTQAKVIVCDITAMGSAAGPSTPPYSDAQVQAITGLMDTTGFSDGPPVRIGVPITEISAGLYAATAIVAALRVWRSWGVCQNVDVSLFACAASALTTFLPKAFVCDNATRVGNRHPACAPWNAYATRDGWILICTSTEEQWRRLRAAIGDAGLDGPCFDQLLNRVKHVDALDEKIEAWTRTLTTSACSALCEEIGIAAGPILSIDALPDEPNFRLRHPALAQRLADAPVHARTYAGMTPFAIHPLSASVDAEAPAAAAMRQPQASGEPSRAPLAGVRVIEIGQYTTAPLVGKHLAALGAEVIKVEPPDGEAARGWPPGQDGLSYFFALNNTDKRAVSLDLKQSDDLARLRSLLASADVLIENLRPGALARLGLDRESLARLNPALIYCSISGFGLTSAYPTRPAFDTVIQAMGGLMARTRSDDVPVKIGASAADLLGGQAALFAIVAAIAGRPREAGESAGVCVEIAMQDVAVWSSLFAAGNPDVEGVAVACPDGYIWLDLPDHGVASIDMAFSKACASSTRAQAIRLLAADGYHAVAVVRVDELLDDPGFAIDVLTAGRDNHGRFWPLLNVPYRLAETPAMVRTVPSRPERASDQESGVLSMSQTHSTGDAAWPNWR